jgi:hypothetical protein
MKPNNEWIKDWRCGINPEREERLSNVFLKVFADFWVKSDLENKSKSTKNRYSSALHALGGYLVERGVFEENEMSSADELLLESISQGEGPLIYYSEEDWQNELDMVSRKLYKYLKANKNQSSSVS